MCHQYINDFRNHCPDIYNTMRIYHCRNTTSKCFPYTCGNVKGVWCKPRRACRICRKDQIPNVWDGIVKNDTIQHPKQKFVIEEKLRVLNDGKIMPDGVPMALMTLEEAMERKRLKELVTMEQMPMQFPPAKKLPMEKLPMEVKHKGCCACM
ncbi:hypothetical protein MMC13_002807 [Lambiella insularis]|nr:hypothetical protein [Lambiella insularis]